MKRAFSSAANETEQLPDLLGKILEDLRFSGLLCCSGRFASPWGLQGAKAFFPLFHYIQKGHCHLLVEKEHHHLEQGDLVMFPHGTSHTLHDGSMKNIVPLNQVLPMHKQKKTRSWQRELITIGEKDFDTQTLCGIFFIDKLANIPFWQALPSVIHIKKAELAQHAWLPECLSRLFIEAGSSMPGASTMAAKMSELVFLFALRTYVTKQGNASKGWMYALQEPKLSKALWLIHTDFPNQWTLEELATQSGMSRTSFASTFKKHTGLTPIHYLTSTRIRHATRMIQSGNWELKEIAFAVGFQSIVGFHNAFKRIHKLTPGAYRKQIQTKHVTSIRVHPR